jgi:hypothetical protein
MPPYSVDPYKNAHNIKLLQLEDSTWLVEWSIQTNVPDGRLRNVDGFERDFNTLEAASRFVEGTLL